MDSMEQPVPDVNEVAAVFSRGEDFALVPLLDTTDPTLLETLDETFRKGYEFCGLLGMVDGQPMAKLDPSHPGAAYTLLVASHAFIELVAENRWPKLKHAGENGGGGASHTNKA